MERFPAPYSPPARPMSSAPFPPASTGPASGPFGYADTLPPPPAPHVVPDGWGPSESVSVSWLTRLARWLGRLVAASVLVFVVFLVVLIALSMLLASANLGFHADLGTFELVWFTAFGCASMLSSFLGGMLATTRNQAEAAALLGSAGVVALLGLSAHHTPGGSGVAIPGWIALLDFFVPLCLILIGAALGNHITHRGR